MPTRWETYPIKLKGGLVSNIARLQQGMDMPGTARFLQNFEPSIKGGYRRINGYVKFDETPVPMGDIKVQGSGQSGTSLIVGNILVEPSVGDIITINGVTGTYTISSVSYSATNNEATLTLSSSLNSSPADKADVTLTNNTTIEIEGLHYFDHNSNTYAHRNGIVWRSAGSGWTKVSTPDYGTVLVNGGSQTGGTLTVDGIDDDDYVPLAGDTFTIDGVEKVYTVTADATVTSGSATLNIYPNLDSSPADNAAITFLNSDLSGGSSVRVAEFNFNGTEHFIMVDGANNPIRICQGNTYKTIQGSSDVVGSDFVIEFKDHIFYGKQDLVTFAAPFTDSDFNTGNGAGSFYMSKELTGLAIFREDLILFMEDSIKRLTGTSVSDWQLLSISNKVGCIHPDTIQEVGGDIVYLGPDGVRYLGATDRNEDFALQLASRPIQNEMINFIGSNSKFCSVVVRKKNQYRIFKYDSTKTASNNNGYLGTQFLDQDGQGFNWASLKGFKAYRAVSIYVGEEEFILFSNNDGYVYRMESGNTFDGENIKAYFYSPYLPINDPHVRKTIYKVNTYHDPESTFNGTIALRFDFDDPNKIQPSGTSYSSGGSFSKYGSAIYGTSTYGGTPSTVVKTVVVGSFFTVSLEYSFEGGDDPFILDTIMLEFSTEDRK